MNKQKANAIEDLDDIFQFFGDFYAEDDPVVRLFVRLYRTSIRSALEHQPEHTPVDAPTAKRRHYKRRYKSKISGEQVDDPLALELRLKYKTPIVAERLNKIMEVLRSHATAMELEDLASLTSLKKWSIDVHLKYAMAKGLVVNDKGKYWAKVVFDRRPDVKVHSKSFVNEEKKP